MLEETPARKACEPLLYPMRRPETRSEPGTTNLRQFKKMVSNISGVVPLFQKCDFLVGLVCKYIKDTETRETTASAGIYEKLVRDRYFSQLRAQVAGRVFISLVEVVLI